MKNVITTGLIALALIAVPVANAHSNKHHKKHYKPTPVTKPIPVKPVVVPVPVKPVPIIVVTLPKPVPVVTPAPVPVPVPAPVVTPTPTPAPPVATLICAKPATNATITNVQASGATANDTSNDTAAIQAAINKAPSGSTVVVPNGTYMIDALTSVKLKSNLTFSMEPNAVLKAIPNNEGSYAILLADKVSNVNIIGGTISGERANHQGSGGEWGMGLQIDSSNNVVVERVASNNNWGDGFYLSGETQSKNITLCTVTADNNRRQGISIESNDGLIIKNSVFKNTNGTAPADGLDIEPYSGRVVQNVQILNNTFSGNAGHGLELIAMDGTVDKITVTGNTFSGNSGSPTYVHPNVTNATISGSK